MNFLFQSAYQIPSTIYERKDTKPHHWISGGKKKKKIVKVSREKKKILHKRLGTRMVSDFLASI